MKRWELAAVLKATARVLHRHYNGGTTFDEEQVAQLWDFYGGLKAEWKEVVGRHWADPRI